MVTLKRGVAFPGVWLQVEELLCTSDLALLCYYIAVRRIFLALVNKIVSYFHDETPIFALPLKTREHTHTHTHISMFSSCIKLLISFFYIFLYIHIRKICCLRL
jgi:hypothetical protein